MGYEHRRWMRVCLATVLLVGVIAPALFAHPAPASGKQSNERIVITAQASRVVAAAVNAKKTYVYITNTGAKYHKSNCRYLKKSKKKVTLAWAKSHRYGACKVCKPPK